MKGDSWISENTSLSENAFLMQLYFKGCSGAVILGEQLTYKSEWSHKRYWEIIQFNSNNSEK